MLKGLYVAYTGMVQEQKRMDNLANNLANADTTGFKKEGLTSQTFETVLVDKIKDDSIGYPFANRIGSANPGVKIGESYVDWSEGSFQVTDVPMDLAIGGKGFFTVEFTNKGIQDPGSLHRMKGGSVRSKNLLSPGCLYVSEARTDGGSP